MTKIKTLLLVTLLGLFLEIEANDDEGSPKIVGGEKSPIMYPYQISLQVQRRGGGGFFLFPRPAGNWSHNCGGSIMNENYFVTAAHCVDGANPERLSILAGTTNLKEESRGSRHLVENCVIHPEYVELNNSDIAVCRLKTPLVFTENISSISIQKEYIEGEEKCLLTGWGYTSMIRGFPLPNDLQRATLPTLTNDECNEKGHNVGKRDICTLSKFGQGACGGDSGGPLVCKGALTGVVSYGTRVCAVGMPDVFTRASEYADWVEQQMTGGGGGDTSGAGESSSETPAA